MTTGGQVRVFTCFQVANFGCRVFFPHDLDAMAGRILKEGEQG